MPHTYTVAPDSRGGFSLAGTWLPYALWYTSDLDAISYARFLMRSNGGRIIVRDSRGHCIITEHVEASEVPAGVVGHFPVMASYRN